MKQTDLSGYEQDHLRAGNGQRHYNATIDDTFCKEFELCAELFY